MQFFAPTAGGVDRFVDGDNDVGHGDFFGLASQGVTASRPPGALDQLMTAQLAEQLLKVRERNLLARADGGQGDRTSVLAQGKIDHRGDGKTALGCQTHIILLMPL